jgi:hypothetical protein
MKGFSVLGSVVCGRRSGDEMMNYFRGLFRALEHRPSIAWDSLAAARLACRVYGVRTSR